MPEKRSGTTSGEVKRGNKRSSLKTFFTSNKSREAIYQIFEGMISLAMGNAENLWPVINLGKRIYSLLLLYIKTI